jgi:hypothetical protein
VNYACQLWVTLKLDSVVAFTFNKKSVSRRAKDMKRKKDELTAQPSGSPSVLSINFINKGF